MGFAPSLSPATLRNILTFTLAFCKVFGSRNTISHALPSSPRPVAAVILRMSSAGTRACVNTLLAVAIRFSLGSNHPRLPIRPTLASASDSWGPWAELAEELGGPRLGTGSAIALCSGALLFGLDRRFARLLLGGACCVEELLEWLLGELRNTSRF